MGEAAPDAGSVAPDLVHAMVPEKILQEDEIVLLLTKPSLFFIFYESYLFVAITLVLGALVAQSAWLITFIGLSSSAVGLVVVLLCVSRFVWALLVWTSHIYMLTNRRILTNCAKSRKPNSTAPSPNASSAPAPSVSPPPPPPPPSIPPGS
jgi:hypothetical protein